MPHPLFKEQDVIEVFEVFNKIIVLAFFILIGICFLLGVFLRK